MRKNTILITILQFSQLFCFAQNRALDTVLKIMTSPSPQVLEESKNNNYENLIMSIIGGVITYLLIEFVIRIVIPKIYSIVYSVIQVEGTYIAKTKNPSGNTHTYEMIIKQHGTKLKAKLEVYRQSTAESQPIYFNLNGTIKDKLILLHGRPIDRKRLGASSLLLEVKHGGKALIGKKMWHSYTNDIVESTMIDFRQKHSYRSKSK
jgi:hypothetical protein